MCVCVCVCVCVGDDSDEEEGEGQGRGRMRGASVVTMSYKSLEKKERDGPQDMGATSIVQIDTEVKVRLGVWSSINGGRG